MEDERAWIPECRAQALLELGAYRLASSSWIAWAHAGSPLEVDGDERQPINVDALTMVERLAMRLPVYSDGRLLSGLPRSESDPRLASIDCVRAALGISERDLSARTVEIVTTHDKLADEVMGRLAIPPSPAHVPSPAEPPEPEEDDAIIEIMAAASAAADIEHVRRALAGVARVRGGHHLGIVADLLAGIATDAIQAAELDQVRTFGALESLPRPEIIRLLGGCLDAGLIASGSLTEAGTAVMRGELPAAVEPSDSLDETAEDVHGSESEGQ